jgi:tetratricopeptide (TPR) repeat protein
MQNFRKHHTARILALVSAYESEAAFESPELWSEQALLDLLGYYLHEQLPDQAMEIADLGSVRFPHSATFHLHKARLLLDLGREELAMAAIDASEALFPAQLNFQLLRAEAFAAMGLYNNAHDLLDALKDGLSGKELSDLYLAEAYVYELEDQFDLMFYSLRNALKENPDNEMALQRIWVSVELSKKYAESISFHEAFLNDHPYSPQGWYNLGQSLEYFGQYEDAIEAFEFATVINPGFEFAYRDCAELYFLLKQYDKALQNYLDVLEQFEPDHDLLLHIGQCYLEMGDLNRAKAYLQKAQRLDSFNDEVFYFLGECFFREAQYQKAARFYRRAIEMEDRREEYFRALGETYLRLGKPDKAHWFFQEAVEIAPETAEHWVRYAQFLMDANQLEEALEVLIEAEEYAVGADLLYCRIACLLRMNRRPEALYRLGEALDEDYPRHRALIEWMPALEGDAEIQNIITTFQPF